MDFNFSLFFSIASLVLSFVSLFRSIQPSVSLSIESYSLISDCEIELLFNNSSPHPVTIFSIGILRKSDLAQHSGYSPLPVLRGVSETLPFCIEERNFKKITVSLQGGDLSLLPKTLSFHSLKKNFFGPKDKALYVAVKTSSSHSAYYLP